MRPWFRAGAPWLWTVALGCAGPGSAGETPGGEGGTSLADLYRFAPHSKILSKVGRLQCNTALQPNSMAVDRHADAYVNYADTANEVGVLYKVSTQDASCGPQPVFTMPPGWARVGMGYSTSGSSTREALYVDATGDGPGNSQGLGVVDIAQGTLTPIGAFTGILAGQTAELTGTGDGRLYGFFTTTPATVAPIAPSTGATGSPVPMNGVPTPTSWAFSFWGGHFYLYVSQGMGTTIADYDPTTGNVDPSYMTDLGFDIVGAGVSTCAPLAQPTQ
jgi:hypothetical protein